MKRRRQSDPNAGHQLYWRISRALLARIIFGVHALIAVWRVTAVYNGVLLWILSVPTILIFLEGESINHHTLAENPPLIVSHLNLKLTL